MSFQLLKDHIFRSDICILMSYFLFNILKDNTVSKGKDLWGEKRTCLFNFIFATFYDIFPHLLSINDTLHTPTLYTIILPSILDVHPTISSTIPNTHITICLLFFVALLFEMLSVITLQRMTSPNIGHGVSREGGGGGVNK
jgi:hypothetical protein